MITLNRTKENKWIFQKNINSKELLLNFVDALYSDDSIDKEDIKQQLKRNNSYRGRSAEGCLSTMGVRLSEICFYMFGYTKDNRFYPSPMTNLFLDNDSELETSDMSEAQIALINLYSMQFPTPYSKTIDNFSIYAGRLLIKLLLDERLNQRLYIDECIFFLMFLEEINESIYNELIESILEFRLLSYSEKLDLFNSVENCDEVFSNCTHEFNYYFLRIFTEFGVFDTIGDELHNDGNLFRFRHGKTTTFRSDAYASRKKYSGYIEISSKIKKDAIKLNQTFSAFDFPLTQAQATSREDWIRELYQFTPLKYIETIMSSNDDRKEIIKNIKDMIYHSKFGTRDGKSFERSLKPVFELFRENRNVEIISGSGDTDLLCTMDNEFDELYKLNVDAKTAKTSTPAIISTRITDHLLKNDSQYCIIVSPRFAKGVKRDIKNFRIVVVEAEVLANYCLNECLSSNDNLADYSSLNELIEDNMGTDITQKLNKLFDDRYGIV